ncbi:uncharacterized protein EV422DRAFT_490905 [Fimicolochytrium jonesii]|uniref:uncharacterized protein n=1 Tax=Fimicolochytrium jonesii TaxID=1396493 RepID=UPI0022FEBD4D|nr:uncharacterized protein EV422DRAFT_490905 [Fimicolochytrium jonesii]KAI8826978.1 hypothetical protein EV422DRAFT_490905 [Fimicolochytrium jonesii]
MMPVEDVVTEIRVTQRVGVIDGFVNCLGIGVIQGSWPKWLTDIWDSWTEDSENIHPSDLPAEQIYALIVLPDGGKDLEHSPPFTISQCKSIVQQLVAALATAEHLLRFEHRDLHWGNVLVRDITADEDMEHSAAIRDHEFKVPCHGIQVCIIDYTWGRVEGEDCIYTAMDDPSLFEGPGKGKRGGDLQFDVYRWMKDEVNDEWGQFFPKTNIFVRSDLSPVCCNYQDL